jgi:hypothetical protein
VKRLRLPSRPVQVAVQRRIAGCGVEIAEVPDNNVVHPATAVGMGDRCARLTHPLFLLFPTPPIKQ